MTRSKKRGKLSKIWLFLGYFREKVWLLWLEFYLKLAILSFRQLGTLPPSSSGCAPWWVYQLSSNPQYDPQPLQGVLRVGYTISPPTPNMVPTSSVVPPTSMVNPSLHHWSVPPHQQSVLPHIIDQSPHIKSQSSPSSVGPHTSIVSHWGSPQIDG